MSKLYEILGIYEQRKQHENWQPDKITMINPSQTIENTTVEMIIDESTFNIPTKDNSLAKKNVTNQVKYQRYALPATGRFAFGPQSEISEIYHYHAQNKQKESVDEMDVEEINLSNLSLKPKEEISASVLPENPPLKGKKNKKNDLEDTSSNKKQNTSKIEPTLSSSLSEKVKDPKNAAKGPLATTSNKPNSQSFTKKSGNPYGLAPRGPIVGTGQTSGNALAKAKMAALGEEWPDEEELPGFSAPVSQSLSAGGQPTKDVMKEASKSLYRQQKLNVAKRKG